MIVWSLHLLAWVYVVIYFAQIVMPRLRKIRLNCAQIVLEKKKHHNFFTCNVEILFENHGVFEKKKNSENKKIRVEKHRVFPIKFSLPKNLLSSQLSTKLPQRTAIKSRKISPKCEQIVRL